MLSQFSKILEKIIYNRFLHFIDKHNLLYAKQYGFIRNSSTSHALYDHYNFIESNLERNNKVASLFLDLKKAFDLVDHKIICNSLNLVILNLHEWFTNNRLILNIDKTKVLPYKDAHIIKAISINSTNICLVSSYTFLGVNIDNNLNFKEHIRKIQLK